MDVYEGMQPSCSRLAIAEVNAVIVNIYHKQMLNTSWSAVKDKCDRQVAASDSQQSPALGKRV